MKKMRQSLFLLSGVFLSVFLFTGCNSRQQHSPTGAGATHQEPLATPPTPTQEEQNLAEAREQLERAHADVFATDLAWEAELKGNKDAFDLWVLRDRFDRIDRFMSRWGLGKVDFEKLGTSTEELKELHAERAKEYAAAVIWRLQKNVQGVYSPDALTELRHVIEAFRSSGTTPADVGVDTLELRGLLQRELKRYIQVEGFTPDPDEGISDVRGIILWLIADYHFSPQDLGFSGKDAENLQKMLDEYRAPEGG